MLQVCNKVIIKLLARSPKCLYRLKTVEIKAVSNTRRKREKEGVGGAKSKTSEAETVKNAKIASARETEY